MQEMRKREVRILSLLFFDTEFTGLHKNTTLISLGIVADNGKKFYAEFLDYNDNQVNNWIKENVIENLYLPYLPYGSKMIDKYINDGWTVSKTIIIPTENSLAYHCIKRTNEDDVTEAKGDSAWIIAYLREWLSQFKNIQFVSDVCHYDFVLLIDLFGSAFDLPENVNPSCHDINQDIALFYGISEKDAFDKSREKIVAELCDEPIEGRKHNALYDAEVIKTIFEETAPLIFKYQ